MFWYIQGKTNGEVIAVVMTEISREKFDVTAPYLAQAHLPWGLSFNLGGIPKSQTIVICIFYNDGIATRSEVKSIFVLCSILKIRALKKNRTRMV